MELPTCILVDVTAAQCYDICIAEDGTALRLKMEAIQANALCPACVQPSTRVHSRYQRRLADLPWAQVAVTIDLHVRRFFCDNPACPRTIFTERLPTIAAPWARRTLRLARRQQQIGLVAGGSAGAALCHSLGCPAGVDLLLALLRQLKLPVSPTPRVLGVDDWAKRRGQTYGTILVDHERECVVDLLEDRLPETLAAWLHAHPGVEIVTRDRAGAYAEGIRAGAPTAVQVADRWHLLKNLTDALTKVFQDHHRVIQAHFRPVSPSSATTVSAQAPDSAQKQAENAASLVQPTDTPNVAAMDGLGTAADRRRQQRAVEAHQLHQQGWAIKAIAHHLHCHPKTISRTLRRQLPLAPRQGTRTRKLAAFEDHLRTRWNAGCHNASRLYREICEQGYVGRLTMVSVYVANLRRQSGIAARSRQPGGSVVQPEQVQRPPTSRQLAWLATQSQKALPEERQQLVSQLSQINAPLKTAVELAQAFSMMVRQRLVDHLDSWLEQAAQSGLSPLCGFARGLREDYPAVQAALTSIWSNGRTEGNVNRVKCLKRQMYGRAGLDLLRQRVLATG